MSHRYSSPVTTPPTPSEGNRRVYIMTALGFLVGLVIGHVIFPLSLKEQLPRAHQVRGGERYEFINPLLDCEVAEGVINAPNEKFKSDLRSYIDTLIAEHSLFKIGVYFRDLNNGPTFGLNEDEPFIPASLMKVPIMIAWFAASEDEPGILDKRITYKERFVLDAPGIQHIPPAEEIFPGATYTIHELIHRAIKYSDNQAVTLLIKELPPKYVRDLFAVLDIPDGVLNGPDGHLSVKEYASFFRVLFNASYLDRALSEHALKDLSETDFNDGLVAGVPYGILIAHKFGEAGDETAHQLHDCGIIYYPKHPYLLCVMTGGKNIDTLKRSIADISHFMYEKVDAQYKEKIQ